MGQRKSSAALKRVLKLLEDRGKFPGFVCRLLWLIGAEKTRVAKDIAGMDTPGCGVDRWLKLNCTEAETFLRQADPYTYTQAMREYRVAWVRTLLVAYLSKGD